MPLGQSDPPNLAEIGVRNDERQKVLSELDELNSEDNDKRVIALVLTVVICLCVALPLLAAIVGLSLRTFHWAAGQ